MYLRAAGVWCLILFCAFLNGGLREALLLPRLGTPLAPMLSGVILSACILGLAYVFMPRLGARHRRELWGIGMFWLLLTLAFESGFGRLAQGRSWQELLAAYTFTDGNLWPLVLLVTLLAPSIVARTVRKAADTAERT